MSLQKKLPHNNRSNKRGSRLLTRQIIMVFEDSEGNAIKYSELGQKDPVRVYNKAVYHLKPPKL